LEKRRDIMNKILSFNVGTQTRRIPLSLVLLVAALFVALLVPFQTFIYPVFIMKVMCFGLFACAFNLLLGYGGLLSFGHAAFFGASAYATAYLCKEMGFGPGLGLLAGMVRGPFWGCS